MAGCERIGAHHPDRLTVDHSVRVEAGNDEGEPAARQGLIADELIAVAAGIRDARPGQNVVIVIGSSSHATHRMVGSVAVSLARHAPVPLVIVP